MIAKIKNKLSKLFLVEDINGKIDILNNVVTYQLTNYLAQSFVDSHHDYYLRCCEILKRKNVLNFNLCRIGRENDGGYIMVDDFTRLDIAYSFGISNEISWDSGIAAKGIPVFMFDHTIDGIEQKNNNFHFFKIGLGGRRGNSISTIKDIMSSHCHFGKNIIIKMDIEGYEYEVFDSLDVEILKTFPQMIIEFHDVLSPENINFLMALEKINKYFQVVHIHPQNVYPRVRIDDNKILTNYIEVTFANRYFYGFDDNIAALPLNIDYPTYQNSREIKIGDF